MGGLRGAPAVCWLSLNPRMQLVTLERTEPMAVDHRSGAAAVRSVIAAGPRPTSPTLEVTTRLFTLTEAELHDLAYHAVTRYCTGLTIPKSKAHDHAARIASLTIHAAVASDYVHEGVDPRA